MNQSAARFRGAFGAAGAALLLLLAMPAAAQDAAGPGSGAPESFTPRTPPTVLLPRLTPEVPNPREPSAPRLPAAPAPVVASPLSAPLPGALPADGPSPVPTASAPPAAAAVVPPSPAAAPTPPEPPERNAEAPIPRPKPEQPAVSPQPKAPVAAEAKPTGGGRTVWAERDVYVRDAPNRGGRIVDGLSSGDRIERMETLPNGWARVARNGRVGYIHGNYLADAPPSRAAGSVGADSPWAATPSEARAEDGCALPDDLPANARVPVAAGTRVRVVSDAYLRAGPGCNARVLDVLEKGETVTVLGNRGTWHEVARDGRVLGFVSGALLVPARGR